MIIENKVAIGFLIIAFVTFIFGYVSYMRFDWVAVSKPINMETNKNYQLHFVSQKSGHYVLELDTEPTLDKREQNCRLGIENYKTEECIMFPEILIISWAIHQGEKLVAEGKSTDSKLATWGKNIIKALVSFNTVHGKEYFVDITIEQIDKALIPTNPAIRVSINGATHKDAYVVRDLAWKNHT